MVSKLAGILLDNEEEDGTVMLPLTEQIAGFRFVNFPIPRGEGVQQSTLMKFKFHEIHEGGWREDGVSLCRRTDRITNTRVSL